MAGIATILGPGGSTPSGLTGPRPRSVPSPVSPGATSGALILPGGHLLGTSADALLDRPPRRTYSRAPDHRRVDLMRARRSFTVAAHDDGPRARCGDAGRRAGTARAQGYIVAITPVLEAIMRERGRTARAIAFELTRRAVRKPRGGVIWTSADAQRLLRRWNEAPSTDRPADRAGEESMLRDAAQRPADEVEDEHG